MRQILTLIRWLLFMSLTVLPVVVVLMMIEGTPLVMQEHKLSYDNIRHVQKLFKKNRPKRIYQNPNKLIRLSQNDINLILDYAVSHGLDIPSLNLEARLYEGRAKGFATIRLPQKLSGKYINLSIELKKNSRLVEPVFCTIGRIKIPEYLLKPILLFSHKMLLKTDRYAQLWQYAENVDQILLQPKMATVHYHLSYQTIEEIKKTGRRFLLPRQQQKKLLTYHNHLASLTREYRDKQNAMIPLIKEMIAFAGKNTTISGAPAAENQAAIMVLALYTIGEKLNTFLDTDLSGKTVKPYPTKISFYGRKDLAKHFIVSAVLSVSAGNRIADFIGLAKEIDDSDGGSGFSFADLAADKAGVKFGTFATVSKSSAASFQKRAVAIERQTDIMPEISDLPERIMALEFKTRYENIDSASYNLINSEISNRLRRCSFYRL